MAVWELIFPKILKHAEITSCFKKRNKSEKESYKPVSIKIFERLIHNQLNEFMETKFSNFSNGFWKKAQFAIGTTKNEKLKKIEKHC